jgi:nucleotide-binding universal stress UspA family protein
VRILVAVDDSGDAAAAIAWLQHLPLPADHTVMVITAVVPPIAFIDIEKAEAVRAALTADARRLVDDAASALRVSGVTSAEVVEGDPREVIGRGAVARFFLGSVSLAVARHAPCPVLVCKGSPHALREITVALDGSDHARRALEWLTTSWALPSSLGVRLLGVAEPQHYPSSAPGVLGTTLRAAVAALEAERRSALEAELSTAMKPLAAQLPGLEAAVITGMPADMIVRDIERRGTDLVVLGARGAGALTRLLLGSVSETVLTHAACSVLIVRPRQA